MFWIKKVPVRNKEDIVYNNALGDIFDYIIENELKVLMPGIARSGKWSREYIEYIK